MLERRAVLLLENSLFPYLLEDIVFIGKPAAPVRKTWKDKLLDKSKVEIYEDYPYMFNERGEVISPPLPIGYSFEVYDPKNNKLGSISIYKKDGAWEIRRQVDSLVLYVNNRKIPDGSSKLKGVTKIEFIDHGSWERRYISFGKIGFYDFDNTPIPLTRRLKKELKKDLKYIDKVIEEKSKKKDRGKSWVIIAPNWLSAYYSEHPSYYSGCRLGFGGYMEEKDYLLTMRWGLQNSLNEEEIKGNAKVVLETARCPYLRKQK